MFRREIDGIPRWFSVIGLWGSGNAVTDRAGLYGGGPTAYTLWDGHALWGPGRPSALEKFPALVSILDADTFLSRYAPLGPGQCALWLGDEALGNGCETACDRFVRVCPERERDGCLEQCAELPRALVDCVRHARSCRAEAECGLGRWPERW